jgi:uncharacterized membrane protein YuzA (DUF378 family)
MATVIPLCYTTNCMLLMPYIYEGDLRMKLLYWLSFLLVIIGALNWGLVGLFNLDLVAFAFGSMSPFTKVIYTVVGIAGVLLPFLKK